MCLLMNKKKLQWLIGIALLIIVAAIVLIPVLRPGLLVTDDGDWMVIRLTAFFQSLREGQFPVRFLGRLNQSYGYPVANFLYPGFLYIGSVLHIFGLPFQTTIEAIIVGSVMLGTVFTFLWLRKFFSYMPSFFGALAYLLMPYLMYDVFRRGSVGEVLVLGLAPIVLFSIESKNKWLLVPIIGILSISHNTLAVFFIPFFLLYITLKKNWDLIPHYLLGVGISSFFWLPALIERIYVPFDSTVISNPSSYFPISNTIIFQSVIVVIAPLLLIVTGAYKKSKEFFFFSIMLIIGLLFASKGTAYFWRIASFVKFIQFPFRFLALTVIAGSWLVACAMQYVRSKVAIGILVGGMVICLGVWVTTYLPSESIVRPEGYFTTNEATTTVMNEYMPIWSSRQMSSRANKRIEFFTGQGTIEEKKVTTQEIDVVIHAKENSVIQINTVYYPGWGALLDQEKATIMYKNEYGFMRIAVPAGDHQLFVEFRETTGRFMADLISAMCVLVYVVFVIIPVLFMKRHTKTKNRV